MHHTGSHSSVADEERLVDQAIITLLLRDARPWSVDELARAIGSTIDTTDALSRLHTAGLVHRAASLVFVSRAMLEAERLLA